MPFHAAFAVSNEWKATDGNRIQNRLITKKPETLREGVGLLGTELLCFRKTQFSITQDTNQTQGMFQQEHVSTSVKRNMRQTLQQEIRSPPTV